jgi:hypothetical protein
MKHIQNNKEIHRKVLRLLPNVCDFQKENHLWVYPIGYGFKNL